jgi:hypothetical protein
LVGDDAEVGDGQAGYQLGLEAGHEDTRSYRQLELAEASFAGQVLQRHPTRALGDQILETWRCRRADDHQLVHLAAGRPERPRRQRYGVKLGAVDPGPGQCQDGISDSLTQ